MGHKWVIYVTIWAKTRYVCIQTDIHFIAQVIATLNNYMHTTLETLPFVYFCFFILAGLCHYPSHPHTLPTHRHIYTGPILLIHSIKNHQKLPVWKSAIILFARLVLQKIYNRSLSIVMLSSYICKRVQYQGKDGFLRLNCHFLKYWQVQTWLVLLRQLHMGHVQIALWVSESTGVTHFQFWYLAILCHDIRYCVLSTLNNKHFN